MSASGRAGTNRSTARPASGSIRRGISVLRLLGDIAITPEPLRVATDLARSYTGWTGVPITAQDVLDSPYSLIGTVAELVDKLKRIRERWGINSFLIGWFEEPGPREFAPVVEQLASA